MPGRVIPDEKLPDGHEKSSKPAIILITCDQLNRNVLSCFGSKVTDTPWIDSLASEGTTYGSCHTVSPWCLPARCSILTGLYPHHSRAYSNFRPCALSQGMDNLFLSLKSGGYHTSVFGKCHFAPVPYGKARPDLTLPYEEFKAYYKGLGIEHLELQDDKQVSAWFYDDYSKELEKAGYLKAYRDAVWNDNYQKVFPFPGPAMWHPDAWTGRKAAAYIRQHDRDKPLFAWVSFSGPHFPFDAPEDYSNQIDPSALPPLTRCPGELDRADRIHHGSYHGGEAGAVIDGARQAKDRACKNYTEAYWTRMRTNYYANVKLIDDQVGEILAAVREAYAENALILFTADHGEMLGNHGLWGKNMCAYDEVWRIPLLVRYPGQVQPDRDDRLVNSTDFAPTCLLAAGLPPMSCDGHVLQDLTWNRPCTFAEGEGFLAVTDGSCKYIHLQREHHMAWELMDCNRDPWEFENRIEMPEYQGVLAKLREQMIEHMMPSVLA